LALAKRPSFIIEIECPSFGARRVVSPNAGLYSWHIVSDILTIGIPLAINTANQNQLESPAAIHEMREFPPRLEPAAQMTKSSFTAARA
jgi:hypothetical protein